MLNLNTSLRAHMATLKARVASLMCKRTPDALSGLTTIEPNQPMRIVCPSNVVVTCVSGIAWITAAKETRDVVLEPGQRHVAARKARLFINGMPRCVLRFELEAKP